MGHRRETFRPRKRRENIRESFESSLNEKNFEKTAQLAITHYTTRDTGTDFATAMLATSVAISLAKDLKWSRSFEDIANMAISVAESKTKRLSSFRKQTIVESVTKTLQRVKEEST